MTKVCAVWYARSTSRPTSTEIVVVNDDSQFKSVFGDLLFDKNADHLLINYKNVLYVIEAVDRDKRLYNRRTMEYHPYSDMVKV